MAQQGYNMVMTYRFQKAVVADIPGIEHIPTPAELACRRPPPSLLIPNLDLIHTNFTENFFL
jgi:hypothetical protein